MVSLVALCLFSVGVVSSQRMIGNVSGTVADIAIEHTQPISITLELATLNDVAIVEFSSNAEERIFLNVPDSWIRRLVRNVPIARVRGTEESFGFTRWQLPPGAGMSFRVPDTPDGVVMHNPSGVPMKIHWKTADLLTEEVAEDITLLHDGSVRLW